MSTWNVYIKGITVPHFITGVENVTTRGDGVFMVFEGENHELLASFPINAVAAALKVNPNKVVATYPVEQTDTGTWIRNVREDGQGHWVPYTGPIYGVKE